MQFVETKEQTSIVKKIIIGLTFILAVVLIVMYLNDKLFKTYIDDKNTKYERLSFYEPKTNDVEGKYRLSIPSINVNVGVIESEQEDFDKNLLQSAVTYKSNKNPEVKNANISIFAHRNGYGDVNYFYYINHISLGDTIKLNYNSKTYDYVVIDKFIVTEFDTWILKDVGYNALTLYSCHPLEGTKQRYVVRAKLKP